ncbi:MAG: threonine/serine exporter family protein [Clostridia bacterium]|nr:threonine/serine exporter family protein [Clostridia bacterium]
MIELVLAFFGSLLPAALFNVNKKHFIWVGLSGSVGWFAYSGVLNPSEQVILSTFAGAAAVGIYSEIMARALKVPATVFSISGIFPLVPGIGAYNTVQLIVENKLSEAAGKGIETLASAGAIALGIMLISAMFRVVGKARVQKAE